MFTLRKNRAQQEDDRSPKRSTIRAGVTAAGMLCIILSATVRTWWQTFLLDFGIGLLLVGIVELAFLGVLRRVLGGESGAPIPKPALTQAELDSVRRLINSTDGQDWRSGNYGSRSGRPSGSQKPAGQRQLVSPTDHVGLLGPSLCSLARSPPTG
jgi:hypothetical protein